MERVREPGTARFGNFINYYSFNPASKRLKLIPRDLLNYYRHTDHVEEITSLCVLDVGCNAGELTVALYDHLKETGHGHDDGLTHSDEHMKTGIDMSQSEASGEVSQSEASGKVSQSEASDSTEPKPDRKETERQIEWRTKHALCPDIHILGVDLDETLIKRSRDANPYPDHVTFSVADVTKKEDRENVLESYLRRNGKVRFDLVTCFSVTLWVHLNHGDAGLREFLRHVSSTCRFLVIEPQPWRCYRTAARRMRRQKCAPFEHFETLTWREAVDEDILRFLTHDCDMELRETFGQTDWERRVCLLENRVKQ